MIKAHLNDTTLLAKFEDDEIDYSFITLIEAKRISNFLSLPKMSSLWTYQRTVLQLPLRCYLQL